MFTSILVITTTIIITIITKTIIIINRQASLADLDKPVNDGGE